MMSEGIVPSWNNLRQQRHVQQVDAGDQDGNNISSSSHVHHHHPPPPAYVVPMSNNYEVAAELTWENGQLAMHGLTGILPPSKAPTFGRAGDTLESIVHQATTAYNSKHDNELSLKQIQETTELETVISGGKRAVNIDINNNIISAGQGFVKKKMRSSSESEQSGRLFNNNGSSSGRMKSTSTVHEDQVGGGGATERSACASATMMTWGASFESDPHGHGSFNTKTTYDDSAFHDASENRDEEMETKGETTVGSHSARRTRAALIHNQSERRRRDRINQKMKALQKLVPNASKTDKASMLDEVINYLKQLQSQVQMMSSARNMPPLMMNPLAMQQQLQMSLLARMGMGVGLGMGMGMLDINALARAQPGLISTAPMPTATPPFLPPHFSMPAAALSNPSHTKSPGEATANPSSVPFADPYSAFLAQQAMNMDFYKMAALYRQQANQATQAASNSQPNIIHRE